MLNARRGSLSSADKPLVRAHTQAQTDRHAYRDTEAHTHTRTETQTDGRVGGTDRTTSGHAQQPPFNVSQPFFFIFFACFFFREPGLD